MAQIAQHGPEAAAVLLASAGVVDAAERVVDEPGIAMVLGMSRALRAADLDGVVPWPGVRAVDVR